MLSYLFSSIGFLAALMLQYGIFSRWTLLSGSADLVMLFIVALCLISDLKHLWILILIFGAILGAISAMPFYIIIVFYFAVYLFAQQIKKRIMQSPLLSMYLLTFLATLGWHAINIALLFIKRVSFNLQTAVFELMLPSLLLNILISILMHSIVIESNRLLTPKGAQL